MHEREAPDVLQQAWQRAEGAWDDPAAHDEILKLTSQHNAYAWTAARYRARKGDAVADRAIDRLQRAAFATMAASAGPRHDTSQAPYRSSIALLGLLLIVLVVGVVYALVFYESPAQKSRHPRTEPARPAPTAPR